MRIQIEMKFQTKYSINSTLSPFTYSFNFNQKNESIYHAHVQFCVLCHKWRLNQSIPEPETKTNEMEFGHFGERNSRISSISCNILDLIRLRIVSDTSIYHTEA